MLGIGQGCVARGKSEELCVELVHATKHWRSVHVTGQPPDMIGHARGTHLFFAQDGDRLDPVGQVLPVLIQGVGTRETTPHADDGDRLCVRGRAASTSP